MDEKEFVWFGFVLQRTLFIEGIDHKITKVYYDEGHKAGYSYWL